MPQRKRSKQSRKSAVALMMVTGGLAAAVPFAGDRASAQNPAISNPATSPNVGPALRGPAGIAAPNTFPGSTIPKAIIPCSGKPPGAAVIPCSSKPAIPCDLAKRGKAAIPCDTTKKTGIMNPCQLKKTNTLRTGGATKKAGAMNPCQLKANGATAIPDGPCGLK